MAIILFLSSIKFGEIKLNKKEFYRSKQPIYLNQVVVSQIHFR